MRLFLLYLSLCCAIVAQTTKVGGTGTTKVGGTGTTKVGPVSAPSGPTVITANVVSSGSTSSGTTITQAVNCTGANYLLVYVLLDSVGAGFSGATATYNGSAMTSVWNNTQNGGGLILQAFRILAPTTGSHNVVVTVTGDTINDSVIICSPMSGVNATVPDATAGTNQDLVGSTTPSVSYTGTSGELTMAAVVSLDPNTITNGAGQTTVAENTSTSNNILRVTYQTATTGTVSSTWTFLASEPWMTGTDGVKP